MERPATASAASLSASGSVGWAWQVRARSSLEALKAIAVAASAIRSPARAENMEFVEIVTALSKILWVSPAVVAEILRKAEEVKK